MPMGERGMRGDHGQAGETGAKGEKGDPGVNPWVVREAKKAYIILVIGVVLSIAWTYTVSELADRKFERYALVDCERGNNRTEQLRNLLLRARAQSAVNPYVTPERRAVSEAFYIEALNDLPLVKCPENTPLPIPPLPPISSSSTLPGG